MNKEIQKARLREFHDAERNAEMAFDAYEKAMGIADARYADWQARIRDTEKAAARLYDAMQDTQTKTDSPERNQS